MSQSFQERLSRCWADHDSDRAAVEQEIERLTVLVPDATAAGRLTALANHVLGQEGGEWTKAVQVCEATIARSEQSPALSAAWCSLSVARHMSGDTNGAMVAETRAAALSGREAIVDILRVRLLLVEALVAEELWDEALPLLAATLDACDSCSPSSSIDRVLAVTCNNVASALVGRESRSPEMDDLLERSALWSRRAWLSCGNWMNDERSDYLLSLTYGALNRPAEARDCATRGLATIVAGGEENVDSAFLHVARARALLRLGESRAAGDDLATAERLASTFDESDWKAKLEKDIESLR